ncbi:MAG: alpha-2-macroglobulin family protein [Desulfovibrio sp.]
MTSTLTTESSSAKSPQKWQLPVIALLIGIVLFQAFMILTADEGLQPVSVTNTEVTTEEKGQLLIHFDTDLGAKGDILSTPPGTLVPETGGVWKWKTTNTLSFTPAKGNIASHPKYTLELDKTFVGDNQVLTGQTNLVFTTKNLSIELVDFLHNPIPNEPKKVSVSATFRFSSWMNPEQAAPYFKLYDVTDQANKKELEAHLTTRWEDRDMTFESLPIEKTAKPRSYAIVIEKGVQSTNGIPLEKPYTHEFEMALDPNLTVDVTSVNSAGDNSLITLEFSSPVDSSVVSKHLEVRPDVKFTASGKSTEITLSGPFEAGQKYRFIMHKGLKALDGAELRSNRGIPLLMPDMEPSVNFASEGMFLTPAGMAALELETVNTDSIQVIIDRVFPNNLFTLFRTQGYQVFSGNYQSYRLDDMLGDRISSTKHTLGGFKNQKIYSVLDLKKQLSKNKGLFRVSAQLPNGMGAQRWVLYTDLGMVTKKTARGYSIWVSSLSTLSPQADVEVKLITNQNQIAATGRTDSNGIVYFPLPEEELRRTFMITAEREDDFTFLLPQRFGVNMTGLDTSGVRVRSDGYRAFIFGERNMYRPGETIQAGAIVRRGDMKLADALPCVFEYRNPEGRIVKKVKANTGKDGVLESSLALDPTALTGPYTIQLKVGGKSIGNHRFQVEEFIPDRIAVSIDHGEKTQDLSTDLKWAVNSKYLFGSPAKGLQATTRVRLEKARYTAKDYGQYIFANNEIKFDAREIFNTQGKLDDEGNIDFATNLPEKIQPPAMLMARITARVQEQGGRGVTATSGIKISPYSLYVGVKPLEKNGVDPDTPLEFAYVTLDKDGTPLAHRGLKATLYRDRWHTIMRSNPSGGYDYITEREPEVVSEQAIPPAKAEDMGKGTVTVAAPHFGSFRLVIEDESGGFSTATSFYAGGWGYSPWAIENPARVELVPDKDSYADGETAKIQIRAPFSGKAMITIETDSMYDRKFVTIKENTGSVSIPIKEKYAPNAYVTCVLIRKASTLAEGEVGRAFGAVPIFVGKAKHQLKTTVTAPEEMRPMKQATVRAKAEAGASVIFAVVDEGILQLSAQKTPDPFRYFFTKRALGVRTADTFGMLFPDLTSTFDAPAGGGGMLEMAMDARRAKGMANFASTRSILRDKPVSFWSGIKKADEDGNVAFTFTVPEFSGALRVMAISAKDSAFGNAQATTLVKSPLMVVPTVPPFMAFKDKAEIPLAIHNETGAAGNFTVELKATGPATIQGETRRQISIDKGKDETLFFTLLAGENEEDIKVSVLAEGNGERVNLTRNIVIRSAFPALRTFTSGTVPENKLTLSLTKNEIIPETAMRNLHIGALPMIQFIGKLDSLLSYPYGCLEQTVSKALPLVFFDSLSANLAPKALYNQTPEALVGIALRKLQNMQRPGGGFSMWPGMRTPHPRGSMYALQLLEMAAQSGIALPNGMRTAAQKYVGNYIRNNKATTPEQLADTCYALFLLAQTGNADKGIMDYLYEQREKELTNTDRTLLGSAYAYTGDNEKFIALTTPSKSAPASVKGVFGSPLRDKALELTAIQEFGFVSEKISARIAELVSYITQDLNNPRIQTTQEMALAYSALSRFFALQVEKGVFKGTAQIGNTDYTFSSEEPLSLEEVLGDDSIELTYTDLAGEIQDANKDENSTATVFYSLITKAIPTESAYKAVNDGIKVTHTLLDRDASPLGETPIKQGDLLILKIDITAETAMKNAVVQCLLPAGIQVENQRLSSTEIVNFKDKNMLQTQHEDFRADRVLLFADLPKGLRTRYIQLRAILPVEATFPPVQVEAMYLPEKRGSDEATKIVVVKTK